MTNDLSGEQGISGTNQMMQILLLSVIKNDKRKILLALRYTDTC